MKNLKSLWMILMCMAYFTIVKAQTLHVQNRDVYRIDSELVGDTLRLDTLILDKRARLIINEKKEFYIDAKTIFIDRKAVIMAHDGMNNGTNLTLSGKFVELEQLAIDVSGYDFDRSLNEDASNGNGGDVVIKYHRDGIKPQLSDGKSDYYIKVMNEGDLPYADSKTAIRNIWQQIEMGGGNRPGGRSGKVYDATKGKDGDVKLTPLP